MVTGWVSISRWDHTKGVAGLTDRFAVLQSDGFIFYSGFTEVQLITGARILTEIIASPAFGDQYVYRKYAHKKFLRASQFAGEWARAHVVQGEWRE